MKTFNYGLLSSLCSLIIGILLVVWPGEAVMYLVITIGVLFLLPGLMGLLSALTNRNKTGAAFPIISVGSALLGLWLIIMPGFFINILMYVLGALLVLAGLNQVSALVTLRKTASVPAVVYVIPVLVLIAGLVVLFNPFEAASLPFIVLGASAIVYSLTDLFRVLRYRMSMKKKVTDVEIIEEVKAEEQ